MHSIFSRLAAALLLPAIVAAAPAHAEGKIRIAEQYGVVYLLLNVAQDQKLIEKHGKKYGVPSRSSGSSCPAAPRSTMRCCQARSISPAPASGRC
jgi:ABC-type nitrate/sulfonate/bicarbonate transport system substrate-binding protein